MNKALPRVVAVTSVGDYRLRLRFTDATEGELDLRDDIVGKGGVFAPLEDPKFFARVKLSHSGGTIEWPNEVDFCPDVLYARVTGKPVFEDAGKVA